MVINCPCKLIREISLDKAASCYTIGEKFLEWCNGRIKDCIVVVKSDLHLLIGRKESFFIRKSDIHVWSNQSVFVSCHERRSKIWLMRITVYPKKYAHGFVVLCFVVVMQSFIMNSHEVFIHIHQGCFAGTGAIVRLPQCQWSKPGGYGRISQCITTTKHRKAKTVCILLGIYCISPPRVLETNMKWLHN